MGYAGPRGPAYRSCGSVGVLASMRRLSKSVGNYSWICGGCTGARIISCAELCSMMGSLMSAQIREIEGVRSPIVEQRHTHGSSRGALDFYDSGLHDAPPGGACWTMGRGAEGAGGSLWVFRIDAQMDDDGRFGTGCNV